MISVIVCSHNPREAHISRAIAALREQTLPPTDWELVVVDNASDDRLEGTLDITWHPLARIVREETLGLTPARLKGIREAAGSLLVFVDDDNVLAANYLTIVTELERTRSFLGAWSGSVTGEFETPPPQWTRRYWGSLMLREVTRDAWSNVYYLDATSPLGAGLCVRRNVAQEYLRLHESGLRQRMLDRVGESLASGGDNDLAACALDIGLGCGIFASLRLTHLMPAERLGEDYLLRLVEGVAYSSVILHSFRSFTVTEARRSGVIPRVADSLRRALMTSRERRFHSAVMAGESRARRDLERT